MGYDALFGAISASTMAFLAVVILLANRAAIRLWEKRRVEIELSESGIFNILVGGARHELLPSPGAPLLVSSSTDGKQWVLQGGTGTVREVWIQKLLAPDLQETLVADPKFGARVRPGTPVAVGSPPKLWKRLIYGLALALAVGWLAIVIGWFLLVAVGVVELRSGDRSRTEPLYDAPTEDR